MLSVDSGHGVADGNLTLGDLLHRWEAKGPYPVERGAV